MAVEGTPVSGGVLKLGFSADPAGFDPAVGRPVCHMW